MSREIKVYNSETQSTHSQSFTCVVYNWCLKFFRLFLTFRMKILLNILILIMITKTESNKFSSCCDGDKQIKFDGICAINSADDRTILGIGGRSRKVTTTEIPCPEGQLRDRRRLCRSPSFEIPTKICKT